jgi:LysW-gamma-L-lysine/LysW-L-ornithine aminotransferase
MKEVLAPSILSTSPHEIEERYLGGMVQRRGEVVIAKGDGSWLEDTAGRRYLDLTSAQGVAMLGHCHPALTAAIAQQAATLISCPNFLYNDRRAEFAQALAALLPPHLTHLFFANSGAEAVDGALKFARVATGRQRYLAFRAGFHGRTVGALSVTWEKKYREPFLPLLETTHLPYNDLAKLEAALDETVAAVVVEAIQGEGGVNVGNPDFLRGAQQLCRERGALLIVDEIQTGFGRTGRWFGFEHAGLEPDIIVLAKGLAAGFPMGGIAYTERVHASLFAGAHGTTFGGNPLACAAGLAALATYASENVVQRAAALGDLLLERLRAEIGDLPVVREIRGAGLMIGIELRQKPGPYLKSLMEEHGVLALPAGANVLRLLPPLLLSREEAEIGVQAIAAVLKA